MIIDKFFKPGTWQLDWDFLMTLPEIQAMDKAPQSPKWHKEGSVLEHTKLCVEYAYSLIDKRLSITSTIPLRRARFFVAAVLLHDVGKPSVAIFKKGGWHHYGHEEASERIIREMIADDPNCDKIALLAKLHMKAHKVLEQKDFIEEIIRMGKVVNLYDLAFVHACDCHGSQCENPKEKEADLERCDLTCRLMKSIRQIPLLTEKLPDKYLYRKKNG